MRTPDGSGSAAIPGGSLPFPVPGIWWIDKPEGISSARVVDVVRRVTGVRRVGHGGTLDPFATGLLPVMVGREFTREAARLLEGDKEYLLRVRLGSETDTGDWTGVTVARGPGSLPAIEEIRQAAESFLGEGLQEPPAHSALKHQGRPLYWYARRGREVVKEARPVVFHEVRVLEFLPPDVDLRVRCGKGAYMRVLARDLGRRLGCLGHLVALRRTSVGEYRVEQAVPLWRLQGVVPFGPGPRRRRDDPVP